MPMLPSSMAVQVSGTRAEPVVPAARSVIRSAAGRGGGDDVGQRRAVAALVDGLDGEVVGGAGLQAHDGEGLGAAGCLGGRYAGRRRGGVEGGIVGDRAGAVAQVVGHRRRAAVSPSSPVAVQVSGTRLELGLPARQVGDRRRGNRIVRRRDDFHQDGLGPRDLGAAGGDGEGGGAGDEVAFVTACRRSSRCRRIPSTCRRRG